MKIRKHHIAVFLVVLLVGLGLAFEPVLRRLMPSGSETFRITALEFHAGPQAPVRIQEGYRGYVVFYAKEYMCSTCLEKLGSFAHVTQQFQDYGYFAIMRGKENFKGFLEYMTRYNMPGEYFYDPTEALGEELALANHPLLLFFNRDAHLVAVLPLDIEYDEIQKQYFRLMEEL